LRLIPAPESVFSLLTFFSTLEQTLPWSLHKDLPHAGMELSRGERQLLTFARALVRDPELLVLDEATSAVDPATEGRIQSALETLQAGRTTLSVAHRLDTIRRCSPIFVMAAGELVEEGDHEALLAKGGVYANLWALQLGEQAP
jgi:ABC-type multidrug transport system fused ATPase/permease subunit